MATLNVILHGTIVFKRNRDRAGNVTSIDALIPTFTDHVFNAGSFLAETYLQPGNYSLEGVEPEEARPDVLKLGENMVFPGSIRDGLVPGRDPLHAKIDLKLPRSVRTMRRARLERAMFRGRDRDDLDLQMQMANIQIFTYTIRRFQDLMLDNHPWVPVQGECVNLHIIAEHDRTSGIASDEFTRSFDAMVSLFLNRNGLDLDLKMDGPVPFTLLGDRPPCVSREELEALAPRTARLERLGRLQTENTPALISQLWFDFNPDDPDAPTCGDGWF
ncbi:MAG: hypothetical protein HY235_16370 [Acidobacteria bacterium]|nr:hypothetical protein [Acidobacteriota bacterium]